MSGTDDEVQLPEAAEALLGSWPAPERDDWDARADAITAAASATEIGSTDAALLAAPLPAQPGEPSAPAVGPVARDAAGSSDRPPVSLAALARESLADIDAKDDARDIAKESLSVALSARASAPVIPEAVRQQAASLAAGMAARGSAPSIPEVAAAQAPAQVPAAAPAPRPTPAAKSNKGPMMMIGLAVAGFAAAAAIVLVARTRQAEPLAQNAPAAASVAATPAPAATAEKHDPDIVALDDLPGAAGGAKEAPSARPKGSGALAAATAPAEKTEPESPTEEPAPVAKAEAKVSEEDKEFEKKAKPAAQPTDVPEKPSTGAVQAAIGAVMGGARACVAGHDAPSRATVTFGSDGRVTSVGVSGPAAGTPAESCIRAALSKARVQPFARPSFGVSATVRP